MNHSQLIVLTSKEPENWMLSGWEEEIYVGLAFARKTSTDVECWTMTKNLFFHFASPFVRKWMNLFNHITFNPFELKWKQVKERNEGENLSDYQARIKDSTWAAEWMRMVWWNAKYFSEGSLGKRCGGGNSSSVYESLISTRWTERRKTAFNDVR